MNKLFLIILLLVSISLEGIAQKNIGQEIRKLIKYDTDLTYGKSNGFHVAIIDGDTSFTFKIGRIDTASNYLFEIGSVTKAITASLVTKLVEQNYFKLEEPINNYLPTSFTNPRMDHITITDLIEHTSGLPKKPNDFGMKELVIQNPFANYSKLDLLRFYRDYLPMNNSQNEYLYAHTNYALLEVVIENATQEPYEAILKSEIFDKLGMDNSYVGLSEHVVENIAKGYDRSGKMVGPWKYRSFAASGGIKTNLNDLINYINANLKSDEFNENHIKRSDTKYNKNIFASRGWHILEDESDYSIYTLSGKSSGHHCMVAFIKETKTGVIVLSNNGFGSKNLAFSILRMINDNWTREANIKS